MISVSPAVVKPLKRWSFLGRYQISRFQISLDLLADQFR